MTRKLMITLASTVLLLASLGSQAFASCQPGDPCVQNFTPPNPL